MSLLLALLQAALAPAPAPDYRTIVMPDGGFTFVVDSIPAASLSDVESMLDHAAEEHCSGGKVVPGEQNYNQAVDSEGNPSPEITDLRATYQCAPLVGTGK